jgi:hypothetical protein
MSADVAEQKRVLEVDDLPDRVRTVSSRSTTSPTWTKSVTPGRWLSIEVKRLARDRRAAGVARISAADARGFCITPRCDGL